MHRETQGAVFQDITYFLREKKKEIQLVGSLKSECHVDFGNLFATSSTETALSLLDRLSHPLVRFFLWMYPVLPERFFPKGKNQ